MFQSYALFPNLTVADNVAYGLVNRKTPRAEVQRHVEELVKLVGLPGSERKFLVNSLADSSNVLPFARALATLPVCCCLMSRSLRSTPGACPATAEIGRCSRRWASPPSW